MNRTSQIWLFLFLVALTVPICHMLPVSDPKNTAASNPTEDSLLYHAMEILALILEEEDDDPDYEDDSHEKGPEIFAIKDILSIPLVPKESKETPSTDKIRKRVKRHHDIDDLFDIVGYHPESSYTNQMYDHPGIYGGGWGTQQRHPVVITAEKFSLRP